jgi:V/A-type H+-transporting ATPase subunit I
MTRVIIAAPRNLQRKAVEVLYEERALHIKDYAPAEGELVFKLGTPLQGAEAASGLLIKLRSFKAALGLEKAPPSGNLPKAADILPKLEASVVALEMSITSAADDRAKLEVEAGELRARIAELGAFQGLPVPLSLLSGYGALAVFTGTVKEGFEAPLKGAVRQLDVLAGEDPSGVVAIFVDRESREAAVRVLLDSGFQEVRVPEGELPAFEEIQAAETALKESIEPKIAAKAKELDGLKEKHAPFILAAAELLEMEVARCETPLRGAQSPNTFVLEGFVPTSGVAKVRRALEEACGGKLHFEAEDVPQLAPPRPHPAGGGGDRSAAHGPGADEGVSDHARANADIPVALDNPKQAGSFEFLVRLMSLPKYGEIDPTMLLFFVFPVFFGMMLGDIGYGLSVVAMGMLACGGRFGAPRWAPITKLMKRVGLVLMIAAVALRAGGVSLAVDAGGFAAIFGSGLLSFLLGGIVRLSSGPRSDELKAVGRLLIVGGFVSFLFGFVFGEFFGFEVFGSHPGPLKFWAHDVYVPWLVGALNFDGYFPIARLDSVPFLLGLTVWIGVAHIFVGMALGFRNQLRAHGFSHALYAKGSWLIVLISGVLWMRALVGVMFGGGDMGLITSDPAFLVGIGLFVVGVVLLVKGEGGLGALELPTLLGNILSYARLLAVGLAGVAIALTANLPLIWAFTDGGVVAAVVGVALGTLGHLLGVFLGILGPGLHALRLHYVEFFTKFYEGGGRAYAPLGMEPKYVAH